MNQQQIKSPFLGRFPLCIVACLVFASSIIHSSCKSTTENVNEEAEVMATLDTFLSAFENGNYEIMEASMAEDAYVFPLVKMSKDTSISINVDDYRRMQGLEPKMKKIIDRFRESGAEPPYMQLEPEDLKITMLTDAAIATFHLAGENSIARRTLVLAKNKGAWKIVHLHASNVASSE